MNTTGLVFLVLAMVAIQVALFCLMDCRVVGFVGSHAMTVCGKGNISFGVTR